MWFILGRKTFFVNIFPFYWFDQKQFFKQIQIFLRICPFLNMLKKSTVMSIKFSFLS